MARILFIEPDRPLAGLYARALREAGHEVLTSSGAQSAISMADQASPDLVLVELQLAEHSGIEFLYEFRSYSDWQRVPAVILSQIAPEEFADNWSVLRERLGVHDYLYKPTTSLSMLLATIDECLAAALPA